MITPLLNRLALAALLGCFLVLSSTGCALTSRGNVNSRPLEPGELAEYHQKLTVADEAGTPEQPSVKVSIKSQFGRKKTLNLPLEQGMTLQNVLTETKVTRRFRDMEINVMRVTPLSNGVAVPLQAEYDPAGNRVGVLHDMTLYPGDHIMIVEDTTSPIDKALGSVLGQRAKR